MGISARFDFFDPSLAFFLPMPLLLAEVTIFVVPVHVISAASASSVVESGSGLVISSIGRVPLVASIAWLICFQPGSSSIEGGHIIVIVLQVS
jgi:hypothetical protein